jgi:hypothetical protein
LQSRTLTRLQPEGTSTRVHYPGPTQLAGINRLGIGIVTQCLEGRHRTRGRRYLHDLQTLSQEV